MKRYLTILILSLALNGCLGGTTPPSQFYTLTPTQKQSVSDKHLSIGIERVRIPNALERPQILTGTSDSPEMTLSELNRWVEPLPSLIQRTLITDLSTALPNSVIENKNFSGGLNDYTILVNIVQLIATPNDKVNLLAWVSIRPKNGETTQIKVSETIPVGATYTDIANAQSILIGRLSEKIAHYITTLSK